MQDAFAYCAQRLREEDKDHFLSALFAPEAQRPALHALYAFDLEVAGIGGRVHEPMAGEIRLQWWRDVLSGDRSGEATANPIAAALLETIERYTLPRKAFDELLEARSFDVYADPMVSFTEFEGYAVRTEGAIIELAARMLAPARPLQEAARHAGIAATITHELRRFAARASRGQLYVPTELLARHKAEPADVLAGRATPELSAALAEMRGEARRHLAVLSPLLADLPAAVRPAFLPALLSPLILDHMERPEYDPFRTVIDVPQWRRQWRMWRAAQGSF